MKNESELQRFVLDELEWEPSIDAAHIGVTVQAGVVTLTGHVTTFAEKVAAEKAAKRVHGVSAVANEIDVLPADTNRLDDTQIATAAVQELKMHVKVPPDSIRVTVDHGHVILEGLVDWQFQRRGAEKSIRHLPGVRDLTNRIGVRPHRNPDDACRGIQAAIRRSALLRRTRVLVAADDGIITLTGDVHSHTDKEEAERIAWSGRGVTRVINCLTITPWGVGPAEEWGY